MSDLGQLLKKARSEKGMNLEELQEITKIQKRYLEAIEEGDFGLLPGNFYVRAFIKSYSEAVGLNPDEVLRLYRNVIPATSVESQVEPTRKKRKKSLNSDRISKWASTVLMWFFPLLIFAFIYVYYTQYYEGKPVIPDEQTGITDELEGNNNSSEIDIVPPVPVNEPEEEKEEEVIEAPPEPQISFVNTDGTTYIYNAANVETLKVEIKVTGKNCWVWVKENNSEGPVFVEATIFTKDHIETLDVDHSLWIRMGNPGNVEIRINDVLIDKEKLLESNPWNLQINLVNGNSIEVNGVDD